MKRRQSSMVVSASDNDAATKDRAVQHSSSLRVTRPPVRASSFIVGQQGQDDDTVLGLFSPGGGAASDASSAPPNDGSSGDDDGHKDTWNYALLIVLYTLQGIPMGLSASIPFLIQQKIKLMTSLAASAGSSAAGGSVAASSAAAHAAKLSYNANAVFALCSWPFSLKLLWAPIVDSVYFKQCGRRKSWIVPVQGLAGLLMIAGADFVQKQLGLGGTGEAGSADGAVAVAAKRVLQSEGAGTAAAEAALSSLSNGTTMNVKGVTAFFFALYFLMATQDIAVDSFALTVLSRANRSRGPICNSIGQNIGYFLSFVGFLSLNDVETSEHIRRLLGLGSRPGRGLVSLRGFIRFMGFFMIGTTLLLALFKKEQSLAPVYASALPKSKEVLLSSDRFKKNDDADDDDELDASQIGLRETYHRLWAVCQLPSVRSLFLILLTYRLPTALSDNVKFLKAVEYGLSKSTTALLSPTVILPLGIIVPIVAARIWHGHPLRQFITAYQLRVTLVPILDLLMLKVVKRGRSHGLYERTVFWSTTIASTAMQAIVSSLQFNAQMSFFASRADPAIGGSYMTLLNTAANLGGTWPASVIMRLVGFFTDERHCSYDEASQTETCVGRDQDPYVVMQIGSSFLGLLWLVVMQRRVARVAALPDDAWRTHLLDSDNSDECNSDDPNGNDVESPTQRGGVFGMFASKDPKNE